MAASCPSSSGIILYILIPPPNSAGTFWREPWTVFAASHSRSRRTVWVKSPRGVKEERGGPAMLGVKRESIRGQAAPEGIPRAMGSPQWLLGRVPGLPLQQQHHRASAQNKPSSPSWAQGAQEQGSRQGSSQAGCLCLSVSIWWCIEYRTLYRQRGEQDGALSGLCIFVTTLNLSALYLQLCVCVCVAI